MAFTRPATGQVIQSTDISQVIDAWEGTSGSANRLQVTQVSDASNYAGDFQNLDTGNSYGLRVRDSASAVIVTFALAAVTLGKKLVMTGLGTYTAAVNLIDVAATWNAAADTFNGIKVNVTNTTSAAASTLFDFQVASTSVFKLTALKAITHALGTVTAAIDQLTLTATWNAGAAAFNGIVVSITNTASAATSRLIDLKVGGTSQFAVGPDGALYSPGAAGDTLYASSTTALAKLAIGAQGTLLRSSGSAPAWFAKGTAKQVLTINAGATDIAWATVGYNSMSLAQGSVTITGQPQTYVVQQYAFASPTVTDPGGSTGNNTQSQIAYGQGTGGTQRKWVSSGTFGNNHTVTWDYVTASGQPRIWALIDKDGKILSVWEAEDPADPEDPDACPLFPAMIPAGGAIIPVTLLPSLVDMVQAAMAGARMPAFAKKKRWAEHKSAGDLLKEMHLDYAGRRHIELPSDIREVADLPESDLKQWHLQLWLRCASRVLHDHGSYTLIPLLQNSCKVSAAGLVAI